MNYKEVEERSDNMNRVELTGRLVRNPEVRWGGQDNSLCIASYAIAVEREYAKEDEQDADFLSCKCFGRKAEFVEKYFCKGMKVGVCGRIQTGSYTNKDGNKVYTTDIIVDQQEFLESKAINEQIRAESGSNDQGKVQTDNEGFMQVPDEIDEELPFM